MILELDTAEAKALEKLLRFEIDDMICDPEGYNPAYSNKTLKPLPHYKTILAQISKAPKLSTRDRFLIATILRLSPSEKRIVLREPLLSPKKRKPRIEIIMTNRKGQEYDQQGFLKPLRNKALHTASSLYRKRTGCTCNLTNTRRTNHLASCPLSKQ